MKHPNDTWHCTFNGIKQFDEDDIEDDNDDDDKMLKKITIISMQWFEMLGRVRPSLISESSDQLLYFRRDYEHRHQHTNTNQKVNLWDSHESSYYKHRHQHTNTHQKVNLWDSHESSYYKHRH